MNILAIILLILKIIGIVLLSVLGIVLFLLLIILFMPIGYRIVAYKKGDDIKAEIKFSWLWIILYGAFSYGKFSDENFAKKNGIKGYVKTLWIKLYEYGAKKEKENTKPEKRQNREDKNKGVNDKENSAKEAAAQASVEKELVVKDVINTEETNEEIKEEIKEVYQPEIKEEIDNKHREDEKQPIPQDVVPLKEEKRNIFQKFKYTLLKIYDKIKSMVAGLSSEKEDSKPSKLALLNDETAKRAVMDIIVALRRLLIHILPRRGNAYFEVGFADPSTTGQIIGIYSMLYPKIGKRIHLKGYFDREVLEADVNMRGHIQLFVVIYLALRLWFNKDFRYLKERLEL